MLAARSDAESSRSDAADLVSICLPTRDRLPFLRKSVAGIRAQTYPDIEVVLSDNWSTDGTREFCLELERDDARFRYTRPAAPVGLYANHNAAFTHCRGRFVSFFHDDDVYGPEIVARFVSFLLEHPTVGIVSCDWDRIDERDRPLAPRISDVPPVSGGVEYIDQTIRTARSAVNLPGAMLRREAIPVPPFDENGPLGFTDHVTWFRIAERWDIGHIPERLWAYRRHRGALSNKSAREIADDHEAAFTAYADDYLARHPEDRARVERWRAAIRRYRFWALAYARVARITPGAARRIGPLARRVLRLG